MNANNWLTTAKILELQFGKPTTMMRKRMRKLYSSRTVDIEVHRERHQPVYIISVKAAPLNDPMYWKYGRYRYKGRALQFALRYATDPTDFMKLTAMLEEHKMRRKK